MDPTILVTQHRRESFGESFEHFCSAINVLADSGYRIKFPVHLNPYVQEMTTKLLSGNKNVHLMKPLPYPDFLKAMLSSWCVITDSGGVQEECAELNIPYLVTRLATERPEGIEAGVGALVGYNPEVIIEKTHEIIQNRPRPLKFTGIYGDGKSGQSISKAIAQYFGA